MLDTQTVLFSYTITSTICVVVMIFLWQQNRKRFKGLDFWLEVFVIQLLAMLLFAQRGSVPDFVAIVIPNSLVVGGTLLLYMGLERYVGKTSLQHHNFLLLAVFVGLHTYFTDVYPSQMLRNLNSSVCLLLICLQCAWLMLRRVDGAIRSETRLVGVGFAVYCLALVVRIFVVLTIPESNALYKTGLFDKLLLSIYQLVLVALAFGLFLMVNRRLFAALEKDIAERAQIEKTLKESEGRLLNMQTNLTRSHSLLEAAFNATADGILVVDQQGKVGHYNKKFTELWRIPQNVLATKEDTKLLEFVIKQLKAPQDFSSKVQDLYNQSDAVSFDVLEFKDGRIFERYSMPQFVGNEIVGRVWSFRDVSERKLVEDALRESEERFRSVVQTASDAILTVDESGKIITWNRGAQQIFQYSEAEIIGQSLILLMPENYRGPHTLGMERLNAGGEPHIIGQTIQVHGRRKDGSEFPIELVLSSWKMSTGRLFTGVIRDITERKYAEDMLQHQSTHDILTGLYNRQHYENEIVRLQMSRRFPVTILMMDVDGLKRVNDSLGHHAGDELLRRVAQVLKNTFRPDDLVARMGGDEFVVVLPSTNDLTATQAVLRLRENFDKYNQTLPQEQVLRVSIGKACGDQGCLLSEVFKEADRDMYRDKAVNK